MSGILNPLNITEDGCIKLNRNHPRGSGVIKNTPEAHKIFGIKNPPSTPSQPGGSHFQDMNEKNLMCFHRNYSRTSFSKVNHD